MSEVVVIDDRITNRNILVRLAGSVEEGIRVTSFADPSVALDWLRHHEVDLIITDYKMPEMDGAVFTSAVRRLPEAADVPVVVITVYEDRSFCYKAFEAGATDFLLSPVDHTEFRARVRNLLALRRHQVALKQRTVDLCRELVTSSEAHEAELRARERRMLRLIDKMPTAICAVDVSHRLTLMNAAYANLTGVDQTTGVGRSITEVLGEAHAGREAVLNAKVMETGEPLPSFEQEVLSADAGTRTLLTTKSPLLGDGGRVTDVVTVSIDITELKRTQARARFHAGHDAMCGLPNRDLTREHIERAIDVAARDNHMVAVLVLDIDRFKSFNDAFGLDVGDLLLKMVSQRLRHGLRGPDVVGRLGEDAFAVVHGQVGSTEEAEALAGRIEEHFTAPFVIGERQLHTSASMGVALYPDDALSADRLLESAEIAMFRAKAGGRNATRFFTRGMDRLARQASLLERELHLALVSDQFLLHYQPIRQLNTGRVAGVEALLRWQHPERGLIRPQHFIPLAEETGLILPLTEQVLAKACAQFRSWDARGVAPDRLAVNLSPRLFRDVNVVTMVERAIRDHGLDPGCLDLELTEGVVLESQDLAAASLERLAGLGATLSLDDFGTGYSSFGYLRRFPVQRLKVDRSFVHRLGASRVDEAIVGAIVDFGHSLDLAITAEGVETPGQLARLQALGCDEAQGDLLGRPLPPERLHALFSDHLSLGAG